MSEWEVERPISDFDITEQDLCHFFLGFVKWKDDPRYTGKFYCLKSPNYKDPLGRRVWDDPEIEPGRPFYFFEQPNWREGWFELTPEKLIELMKNMMP